MPKRINAESLAPDALRAVYGVEQYVRSSSLDHSIVFLVKLVASYINGCAYCVDMHSKEARANGETEQRIYAVPVWRETPFYTDKERAAFSLTEVVTRLGHDGVPESVFVEARAHFSDTELVSLVMAIVAINTWNRLVITFGSDVGSYTPAGR